MVGKNIVNPVVKVDLDTILDVLNISYDDFYFSTTALVIPVITATISTLSSLLVMSTILRSQSKLSSSYHRIMFFMSFWDTVSSIAIALVTLPMPSDVIYPFAGHSLGNSYTCTAQGFFILAGQGFTMSSNVTLNIYYLCTIRYGMREETFRKRLEPTMLFLSCLITITIVGAPLAMNLFNPRPYEPYCLIGSYPDQCNKREEFECIDNGHWGSGSPSIKTEDTVFLVLVCSVAFTFLMVFISMVLVVISVYKTELTGEDRDRDVHENENSYDNQNNDEEGGGNQELNESSVGNSSKRYSPPTNDNIRSFDETRTVLRLALMYIGAFFLTWIWSILSISLGPVVSWRIFWNTVDRCKLIFSPLQGFFNAVIFMCDKAYMVRRSESESSQDSTCCSFLMALRRVIFRPHTVPDMLISRIDMVENDNKEAERINQLIQADLEREQDEGVLLSEISPASIPSDFVSIDTPSFQLSTSMSLETRQRNITGDEILMQKQTESLKVDGEQMSTSKNIRDDEHKDMFSPRRRKGAITSLSHSRSLAVDASTTIANKNFAAGDNYLTNNPDATDRTSRMQSNIGADRARSASVRSAISSAFSFTSSWSGFASALMSVRGNERDTVADEWKEDS